MADCWVSVYPNAGLPNAFGQYDELPPETGELLWMHTHDEGQRMGRSGANWNSPSSGNGHAHASSYPAAGDADAWPEHQSRNEGGFGS